MVLVHASALCTVPQSAMTEIKVRDLSTDVKLIPCGLFYNHTVRCPVYKPGVLLWPVAFHDCPIAQKAAVKPRMRIAFVCSALFAEPIA